MRRFGGWRCTEGHTVIDSFFWKTCLSELVNWETSTIAFLCASDGSRVRKRSAYGSCARGYRRSVLALRCRVGYVVFQKTALLLNSLLTLHFLIHLERTGNYANSSAKQDKICAVMTLERNYRLCYDLRELVSEYKRWSPHAGRIDECLKDLLGVCTTSVRSSLLMSYPVRTRCPPQPRYACIPHPSYIYHHYLILSYETPKIRI